MVRLDDSGNVTKCWLSPDELAHLERAAGNGWTWEREIAMQLMGRCGLRADEVDYPGPDDLRWSEDGECWLFEIRGKNTKGGEPTVRDAWMPTDVQDDIHKFARERGIADGDLWVDAATSTVRRWVKDAAGRVQEAISDKRWQYVSSHDLRRSWATYHLVERQVDVHLVHGILSVSQLWRRRSLESLSRKISSKKWMSWWLSVTISEPAAPRSLRPSSQRSFSPTQTTLNRCEKS